MRALRPLHTPQGAPPRRPARTPSQSPPHAGACARRPRNADPRRSRRGFTLPVCAADDATRCTVLHYDAAALRAEQRALAQCGHWGSANSAPGTGAVQTARQALGQCRQGMEKRGGALHPPLFSIARYQKTRQQTGQTRRRAHADAAAHAGKRGTSADRRTNKANPAADHRRRRWRRRCSTSSSAGERRVHPPLIGGRSASRRL